MGTHASTLKSLVGDDRVAQRRLIACVEKHAIVWEPSTLDLVPGTLCTARFALPDDPVYAVTQRNLLVSFSLKTKHF